jgi:hypothetical protein
LIFPQKSRLASAIGSNTTAGLHARAVAVEFIAWIYLCTPQLAQGPLKSALAGEDAESVALRSILLGISQHVGAELRLLLRDEVFRGVEEFQSDNNVMMSNAASRLVAEVLDDITRELPIRPSLPEAARRRL